MRLGPQLRFPFGGTLLQCGAEFVVLSSALDLSHVTQRAAEAQAEAARAQHAAAEAWAFAKTLRSLPRQGARMREDARLLSEVQHELTTARIVFAESYSSSR